MKPTTKGKNSDPKLIGGINFGPIWGMSGVQNFFGQGYPFHGFLEEWFPKGFTFDGITFVAKTTTLNSREGNMPTVNNDGMTPQEWRPACIITGWWQWLLGVMLNAVGLTGPGTKALLSQGSWQRRTKPFMISFMTVTNTLPSRMEESELFLKLLATEIQNFNAPICLQKNITCPNVKDEKKSDTAILEEEFRFMDMVARYLPQVPVIYKLNVLVSPVAAFILSSHRQCGGICITNTLPWSALKWWQKVLYFPSSILTRKSPLHRFGDGGLSGKPLLRSVEQWVSDARLVGFDKHINAGGGITCADDVNRIYEAGADSVAIGSVASLRPWRLRSIRDRAYSLLTPQSLKRAA